ncbi:MAG: GDP-mannose 4,6-dehydratase [Candidatus Sumerlaeia bacterium]|nr:GDP-mannose 4,6-dehydratase [Candidatus Sumerlaeia bacterium]
MRVLVTGIGGFVGPHLAVELAAHGHEVWGAGVNVPRDNVVPAERVILGDLARAGQWDRVLGESEPQVVVHLASQSHPGVSWEIPRETFEANVLLTIGLVQAAGRVAPLPRILYISSSDVYGIPEDHAPLTEDSPAQPANPYAVSKLAAEHCLRLYAGRLGMSVAVARPFSHTGPGQTARFVVPAFARQVALVEAGRAETLEHGDLGAHRDFSDVRDVVRAYRLLVEHTGASGVYNIASGRCVTIGAVLESLCRLSRRPVTTHFDPRRSRGERPSAVQGDASRLARETGWQPQIPLEETLRAVLDEQRELVARDPSLASER